MDIKQETQEAMNMLQSVYDSPRAKAVLAFAQKRLEKAVVTCPDGSKHAASMYAWQLYCNADALADSAPAEAETFQIVSVMSALEESATDRFKNYGSKLLYDMRKAGIGPNQKEFSIFLAMENSWNVKVELMNHCPTAVYFYAGRLLTLYNTLPGMKCAFEQKGAPIALPESKENTIATIERLAMTYIPECVGKDNAPKVVGMLKMLRHKSDFYTAVGNGSYENGSLAAHSLNVIDKLVTTAKPTTPAQLGECVLAGLVHDVAEAHIVKKKDAEGNAEFISMPFGHEKKVLFIIGGYLDSCMPESVASAIDTQMEPCLQMMEQPLGLYLHIADIMATFINQ